MLRISERTEHGKTGGQVLVIAVAGSLVGEELDVLEASVKEHGQCGASPIAIDLRDLRGADQRGCETLASLRDRGLELRHVPQFITVCLRSIGTVPPTSSSAAEENGCAD